MKEHEQAQKPVSDPNPDILAITPTLVPRDRRGRIRWPLMSPEDRIAVIRQEAQALLATERTLTPNNAPGLIVSISKYYPGGLITLKEDLGQPVVKKRSGFWTPEAIEAEAMGLVSQGQSLSGDALIEAKRADLSVAISRKYPGKLTGLKATIGISNSRIRLKERSNSPISSIEANQQLRRLME